MRNNKVITCISASLYKKIVQEKYRLRLMESKKIKSRRNIITMVEASNSLARRLN